jgi:hypothetical protein
LIYCSEDRTICEEFLRSAKERGEQIKPLSTLIAAAGRQFIGAPYEALTLEREGPEELVVNLRGFDCVTFVEAAVTLARLVRSGKAAFADYAAALERIRYRRGRCDGYPSRLHYFSDWLADSRRKRVLRDITAEIGGVPFEKAFHAVTDRRTEHPGLSDPRAFRRMRLVEGILSRRRHFFIPGADLKRAENRIAEGDIIAITTDQAGIDVSHAGIAVRLGGTVRLLHASSAAGGVVISEGALGDYLTAKPSRTGIIVGRTCSPWAGSAEGGFP